MNTLKLSYGDCLVIPAASKRNTTVLPILNLVLEIDAGEVCIPSMFLEQNLIYIQVEKRCGCYFPVGLGGNKKAHLKRVQREEEEQDLSRTAPCECLLP